MRAEFGMEFLKSLLVLFAITYWTAFSIVIHGTTSRCKLLDPLDFSASHSCICFSFQFSKDYLYFTEIMIIFFICDALS